MKFGRQTIEQHDGAMWNSFFDYERNPDLHFLILTSAGRDEFLHSKIGYQSLKTLFKNYRSAENGQVENNMRDFLGSGQQANVYGMTDRYAIREVQGNQNYYSALSDLSRIARLSAVVEGGLPRWITANLCDV